MAFKQNTTVLVDDNTAHYTQRTYYADLETRSQITANVAITVNAESQVEYLQVNVNADPAPYITLDFSSSLLDGQTKVFIIDNIGSKVVNIDIKNTVTAYANPGMLSAGKISTTPSGQFCVYSFMKVNSSTVIAQLAIKNAAQ